MPCYLVHGFRWPRRAIRIHIIMENIEDAAAEYLVEPGTSRAMLDNFYEKFPEEMERLPGLRFVEQYDPQDTSARALSQPYAFVADAVRRFDLSINIEQAITEVHAARCGVSMSTDSAATGSSSTTTSPGRASNGSSTRKRSLIQKQRPPAATAGAGAGAPSAMSHTSSSSPPSPHEVDDALDRLREQLAPEEKVGWWVVYNGDESRVRAGGGRRLGLKRLFRKAARRSADSFDNIPPSNGGGGRSVVEKRGDAGAVASPTTRGETGLGISGAG